MKTLLLVRHAKSSWDNPGLPDHDRPLNKRGLRDAPMMGARLRDRQVLPDVVISSSAVRARTTAEILAGEMGYQSDRIVVREEMYEAGLSTLLDIIASLDDRWETVMLVGHNPTMTYAANEITGTPLDNVPTCGIAEIRLDVPGWSEAPHASGDLVHYDYPKRI